MSRIPLGRLGAPDEAKLVHVACRTASSLRTVGGSVPAFSGGTHPCGEHALAAALGEAVERYSASYAPARSTVSTTRSHVATSARTSDATYSRMGSGHRSRRLQARRIAVVGLEAEAAHRLDLLGIVVDDRGADAQAA